MTDRCKRSSVILHSLGCSQSSYLMEENFWTGRRVVETNTDEERSVLVPSTCQELLEVCTEHPLIQHVQMRIAQSDHFSSREHALLKFKDSCAQNSLSSTPHVSFLASPDTDHYHSSLSPTSNLTLILLTHPTLLSHDPYKHCDNSRRSRISNLPQVMSPRGSSSTGILRLNI